ncbi:HAMP domain-containing protein [Rhodoferax sp. AJA081-3]|uniref:sensor histidine kinase n=1 Tax=Rhodoferax sp. AJA081-3 TaxID=2752316 RepID=UPI001AE07847|nr:HAMP domain-containing sensor histidine kinase [Rhodoferax sp. AJA081-3]QTN30372.1 HAMP domain-containing protein [Rhodoferax sp. AJA081-3]
MFKKKPHRPWHHRARHALGHSLRGRLVTVFLLLAMALAATFTFGMQKALSVGWRVAARPLVSDYVDRLAADIGSPPSIERAQALTQRLPVSVQISGPVVNWRSSPQSDMFRHRHRVGNDDWQDGLPRLLSRTTADGHRIDLGVSVAAWENQPHRVGWYTLAGILALTALAYGYIRRLLRPLDDIRDGAQRFGSGDFAQPIPIRRRDELGQLATDVNTMAGRIHQMLEAKRGLLLAISHELRSPLTRARLNTELLPEVGDVAPRREALLRDLGEMRDLVTDLLESERLGQGHAALQLESVDLAELIREVAEVATPASASAQPVALDLVSDLPPLQLDRTRMRLLLRNLLDNALRHSADAAQPPMVRLQLAPDAEGHRVCITVRDYGSGVDEDALPHLAEPFYRPDSARGRTAGGVGLGLYLCKLVAQAHGGSLNLRNAQPGLEASLDLSILLKETPSR